MIIFLYGKDNYRSRLKLNEIINYYEKKNKSGLNLKYLDFTQNSYEDFHKDTQSTSMFAENKLFILKNAGSNENFRINFLGEFKKFLPSKDIILFYEEGEVSPKDKLFNFLKKHAKSQEFKVLKGQELSNWVKKEFEKNNTGIDSQALEQLINFTGNNLWQLSGEIKKLSAYKKEKKHATVTLEDISLLVKPKKELDIFETIDALASRNKKRGLALIHQHLEKGDAPLYLISMICFQFRNLLMIKSYLAGHGLYKNYINALSQKLGMNPYIVKKLILQLDKFTLEDLNKTYKKIFQADLAIKKGIKDPLTAVDMLIAEI